MLVRRSTLSRDEEFARLVTAYRPTLLRYGLRRLDDLASAEDLVADTFVVVWRRLDEVPLGDEEIFWLYAVAGNLVKNALRGRQRSLRLEARLALERRADGDVDFNEENLGLLLDLLTQLTSEEQEILRLVYWEKVTYRQLGLVLGCSEKAAGIRVSRLRHGLRDRLRIPSSDGREGGIA
jgi:RNA polymerase sigma-70 factor (ECF subfamily)